MNEATRCANVAQEPPIADKIMKETELLRSAYEVLFRIGQQIKEDDTIGIPDLPPARCMKDGVDINHALSCRIAETAKFIYNELFGG